MKKVHLKDAIFTKEAVTWKKIVGLKENHNVSTVKNLDMWLKIVDSRTHKK